MRPDGSKVKGRGPLRIVGRKRVLTCAFCGRTKGWPEHFVSRIYSQCLTCWLRDNPTQIEPMRLALHEVATGGLAR